LPGINGRALIGDRGDERLAAAVHRGATGLPVGGKALGVPMRSEPPRQGHVLGGGRRGPYPAAALAAPGRPAPRRTAAARRPRVPGRPTTARWGGSLRPSWLPRRRQRPASPGRRG